MGPLLKAKSRRLPFFVKSLWNGARSQRVIASICMDGLVCGLLGSPSRADKEGSAGRARDLTVSWLRWNYFGDILEDEDLGRLLTRASDAGHCHCLVQGYGTS
jgi:hypothetical protein